MSTCLGRSILRVKAPRRGLFEITARVQEALSSIAIGADASFVHLFLQHTSASLVIQENADPSARHDLELYFDRLVPFDYAGFKHTAEGPDDMPSHVKTVLAGHTLLIPVADTVMMLGTWQGIYLWEHREACSFRQIVLSLLS